MCGLAGIYHPDGSRRVDERAVLAMLGVLGHRGPDDQGSYVSENVGLGHRRLSIFDLSAAGHQPMSSEDQRFWIVFNGEIYNHPELRLCLSGEGHRFRSCSDTEVVLRLFQEEGPTCLRRLNGIYAFAIWDAHERRLFAARDRLGVKPFYYAFEAGSFVFASEIKALWKSGLVGPERDSVGLLDYLTFQFCLAERTLFRGVQRLLPGECLELGPDGVSRRFIYWDADFTVDRDHNEDDFQQRLAFLLEDAVRLQSRADVPVGAHLSGGLDSTAVTCFAARLARDGFHTFSAGFREGARYDETGYARLVAERLGTTHHEVFPGPDEFVASLPRLMYQMDEPAAGPGLFPQYCVSRLARDHVKVVLGGQGGDEIFGGYTRYLIAYLEACLKGAIEGTGEDTSFVVTFESILPNLTQLDGYQALLGFFWREDLFGPADLRYYRLIDRGSEVRPLVSPDVIAAAGGYDPREAFRAVFNDPTCQSLINRMTRFDLKTLLPALLHVEDRASMAASLESRVPLLDHRIVELVASMPPMVKFRGGRSKHVFREVVRHVVPNEVLARRDKMGFPVPLSEWCREGPVREFARDTLLSTRARQRGLWDSAPVEDLLNREQPYSRGLWGLLCLELWQQAFLDGAPGPGC